MLNVETPGRTGIEVTTVGLGCAYLGAQAPGVVPATRHFSAEALANAKASSETIPDAVWQELQPLIQTWDSVARQ